MNCQKLLCITNKRKIGYFYHKHGINLIFKNTVLVINIVAQLSQAALWMRCDNVLTDTLLSNPKLSSLIFLANTRGLRSTSRCTTLRVPLQGVPLSGFHFKVYHSQGSQGSFAGVSWWFLLGGYFVAAEFSHTLHGSLPADTRLVRDSPCGVSSLVES